MIVATCDCGGDAPFIIEEERKGPVYAECEQCGQTYKLTISKAAKGKIDLDQ